MNRSLLAVLAHPDDESYGIGGTLARYSAEGVDVHVAIATDGAAGSIDENWQGDRSKLVEARYEELDAAAGVLGAKVHRFGYRDSGFIGDKANADAAAFMNADIEEASARVIDLFRLVKPDVVITHDPTGGYFHPDHIQCNKITTAAFDKYFHAEGEINSTPPIRSARLYYTVFSNRWVKIVTLGMRLRGVDPTRVGRNQDIDLTNVGVSPGQISTSINYRKYWEVKREASSKHGSQGGGTSINRLFPVWVQKQFLSTESYIRAYPPVPSGFSEKDLFSKPFP